MRRKFQTLPTESQAIFFFIIGCAGAAFMVSFIRYLSDYYHFTQIVFFRNIGALIFFLPWLLREGSSPLDFQHIRTTKLKFYVTRALIGLFAMNCYFYSLTIVPLTVATALSFISPIITALFAVLFLGERFGIHRWGAIFIGFLGTLVILRPGTEAFDVNALFVILSASMWAISSIIIKNASKTDSPHKIAFYMSLLMTPLSLPAAIPHWEPITFELFPFILAMGYVSMQFQVFISRAISMADMATILPYDFTRLIFVAIISYFFFDETLDLWTTLGATIILLSAVYASYRERLHKNTHG